MKTKLALPALALLPLLLWLTGCVTGDPSIQGQVSRSPSNRWIPPSYEERRSIPVLPAEEVVQARWNAHQGPWAIGELLDISLHNNPLTQQSWENARATAYTYKASQSTLYPTVGLTEQLLAEKVTGSDLGNLAVDTALPVGAVGAAGVVGSSSSFSTNEWIISTLSASYLILDFGGRCAGIEAARQGLLAANWRHNRTIQVVILSVLTNYYTHLEAKALFAAKEQDIKDAQENLNAAQGQFNAGVKAKLDVLLAKSNLANTKLILEKNRGLVKITLGQLATSLGIPANIVFDVQDLPEEAQMERIDQSIEELIAIAKQDRPDLAAAEANWRIAREDAVIAWSSGLPTLTANSSVQDASNFRHPILNSTQYNGFLMLNVPLYSGFLYVNQTRSALAGANAAYAGWKQQEENVILDVVTSYYDYKTAVETVRFSNEYFDYTKEAYDVAFASYKSGVGTILDLLAAQGALSNARAQKIQARTQWITSLTNVAYATGQL